MTQTAQTIIVNARFDDDSKINKWKIENDILHFEKKYYIFSNFLRRELLKQNHDDSHANHFEYENSWASSKKILMIQHVEKR
jgi:hypothetical protein